MKSLKVIIFVLIMSILFTGNIIAAICGAKGCTARIASIYPSTSDNGRVFIRLKDVDMSLVNCTPVEGVFFSLYKSNSMFAENMKLIQTAAVMGQEIYIRIYESSDVCEVYYVRQDY